MSGADFQREVGDDVGQVGRRRDDLGRGLHGYKIDREWLRSLLEDAMEAARKGSIREVLKREGE